jgi:xylan 1,4-beta-xylosidase
MKPFVELGFMPSTLASGGDTVFHYKGNITPPKDFEAWNTLISKLVGHWVERYGVQEVRGWFFEVWNEPNLKAFWTGTQADYFKLYEGTARAIKAVHRSLRVGGPASAANAWVADFRAFCKESKVPCDFISTHHYPTDAFGKEGDDTVTQLSLSTPSVLRTQAAQAKAEVNGLPLYYTEWSTSSNPRDELHDQPYASAFIVKTILEARGLVEGYSYWTFSDIFEENYFPSVPFHGGFGLLNIHGIAKPAYRAFQLLHSLGDRLIPLSGPESTVSLWAVRGKKELTVVAVNFALPKHPIQEEEVKLTLSGAPKLKRAEIRRIDERHCNPRAAWVKMGSPGYPTPAQVKKLSALSELRAMKQPVKQSRGSLELRFRLPPLGVAAIRLAVA